MQLGDGVRVRGEPERERRQPEAFAFVSAAEREELLPAQAGLLGERADIPGDELLVEDLVPGGHRCVRGEDRRAADVLERRRRLHPVGDELAHSLDLQKCRVALVEMEDRRLDPECGERSHAADAEQQLLTDPVLAVAAVERVREPLDLEQIERDRPDVLAPDSRFDRSAADVDLDRDGLADEPRGFRIDRLVVLGLAARWVDALAEVAAAVEEPDADERHTELGGRLQVVSGEHAEPAGVDREPLVEPELHAEVRDAERLVSATGALPPAHGVCGRVRHKRGRYRVAR